MKPIKAKELIPLVSAVCELKTSEVEEIVGHYWREIRKNLSSMKHSRIHVTNLGDFKVKHWKLQEKIDRLEKFEESNRQKGLQKITARFKTAETLYDLRNVKKLMEEEKQREEFIRLHKKNSKHGNTGKDNSTLEK